VSRSDGWYGIDVKGSAVQRTVATGQDLLATVGPLDNEQHQVIQVNEFPFEDNYVDPS
jgi:hypothetical protein